VVHIFLGISEKEYKELLRFWEVGNNGESTINWKKNIY
jgi:hypothetical protein